MHAYVRAHKPLTRLPSKILHSVRMRAAALEARLPPAVLNQPPTGVYSSRWCMEASMFQRSALWVQNNEALVAGGAMSLFSASLALGALL